MLLYADRPAHRSRQLAADGAWLLLVVLSVVAGRAVHGAAASVAAPARGFSAGSRDLAGRLSAAGDAASGTPLIGDDLAGVLGSSAASASSLARAADAQVRSALELATLLGVLTALVPIALVTAVRLLQRVRWARAARRARGLSASPAGERVLALRALQRRAPEQLLAVHPDPAAAWQAQDPAAVRALADLELRALGVERPTAARR
ncbi:hypothetical protein [Kineococcus radiotolerans]|uniref:hypothetical protein n=1 Tax=Kineococcus radiotolerans TaxID=131568 RepID=UPI0002D394E4|nr:hypothetical protein [Kineococcus radiotolerans]